MLILTLSSPPPSSNGLFANVKRWSGDGDRKVPGRVKTEIYNRWRESAGWEIKAQRPEKVRGPVMIDLTVKRFSDRADIDGKIKAALDLLVWLQVIDDDRHVTEVRARWGDVPGCTIVITPMDEIERVPA